MGDRDCRAAEIEAMHEQARHDAVADAGPIRPWRPRRDHDDRHQADHDGHADRKVGQRLRAVQDVLGCDNAGAPKQDKDRRGRARGKSVKGIIHLKP